MEIVYTAFLIGALRGNACPSRGEGHGHIVLGGRVDKRAARKEEIMSIRDLGKIELTVFVVLIVAFVTFFGLYVMLRHRKQVSGSRKLLKKRARMEEAVRQKIRAKSGEGMKPGAVRQEAMSREEYEMFAPQNGDRVQEEPQRRGRKIVRVPDRTEPAGGRRELQEEYAEEFAGKGSGFADEYAAEAFSAADGKPHDTAADRLAGSPDFREEYADGTDAAAVALKKGRETPEHPAQKRGKREQEPLRMWDNNSKSVRTAKRSQQDPPFFVEERRISHRRDQLKRLEEEGKAYDAQT